MSVGAHQNGFRIICIYLGQYCKNFVVKISKNKSILRIRVSEYHCFIVHPGPVHPSGELIYLCLFMFVACVLNQCTHKNQQNKMCVNRISTKLKSGVRDDELMCFLACFHKQDAEHSEKHS